MSLIAAAKAFVDMSLTNRCAGRMMRAAVPIGSSPRLQGGDAPLAGTSWRRPCGGVVHRSRNQRSSLAVPLAGTGWRWLQQTGASRRTRKKAYGDVPQSGAVGSDATYVRVRGVWTAILGVVDGIKPTTFGLFHLTTDESDEEIERALNLAAEAGPLQSRQHKMEPNALRRNLDMCDRTVLHSYSVDIVTIAARAAHDRAGPRPHRRIEW